MKKKFILILLMILVLPIKVFASGGFGVSSTSISMYPGESKTITITSSNAVGRLNISSTNSGVASVSPGSVFIQNSGSSASITITASSVGTSTISVVASDDFATMDEEILAGQTKTISVNVIEKPVPPSNNNNNNNNTQKPNSNTNTNVDSRSNNNNIKELIIEGYELNKVDENNYSLNVSNDVNKITIKASAEDSKTTITGVGEHEIIIGDNNFEIIVTAENGSQKKINIKVVRKDGYYLEDLDSALKNDTLRDVDIIIKSDTVISAGDLEKIKSSKKIIKFNYYNDEKELVYSWIIDGSKLNNTNDLLTTILYDSENKINMAKLSNYADGLFISLKQDLTKYKGTKIKLYVGNKYSNDNEVNIYGYTNDNSKLELLKKSIKVQDGYIEFEISDKSDYLITMSNISNADKTASISKPNLSIILIVETISLLVLIAIVIVLLKEKFKNKNAKINANAEISTEQSNLYDNQSINNNPNNNNY